VTLADGERHGYAILREIRSRTNAALDPGAGSLYGAIQKLLTEGAIEECRERPHPHLDDKRRRYYRITDFGRRIATEEVERLREVVRFAHPKFPSKSLAS
jgi:DNA-binding PadR family transcriptional regulator